MMTNEILSLLEEMKINCRKPHNIYNDPKSTDKAEALNFAIFAVKTLESIKDEGGRADEDC